MIRPLPEDRSRSVLSALLYCTFFLTGICIAAPGAMLPLLAVEWRVNDAGAGTLLFGFFVGSSVGGLCARGPLFRVFAFGCLLAGFSTLALGSVSGGISPLLLLTLFGFALGLCMTSISLQQSRSNAGTRVAELARLNLVWATGALAGPVLCLRTAAVFAPAGVFHVFSACFFLSCVVVVALGQARWKVSAVPLPAKNAPRLRGLLPLLGVIPLATGLESAAGGWLTTYAGRSGSALAADVGLASVFWAGLLLCRVAYTHPAVAARVGAALRWNPVLVVFGIALLWVGGPPAMVFAGAFCFGWGLGSLYPIALALLLGRTELGNLGFLVAGIGGSCLPLLTGFVSHWAGSIRAGIGSLIVPSLCLVLFGRLAVRNVGR